MLKQLLCTYVLLSAAIVHESPDLHDSLAKEDTGEDLHETYSENSYSNPLVGYDLSVAVASSKASHSIS